MKFLIAIVLVAGCVEQAAPIPNAAVVADDCGEQPTLPDYAPPTRTTDPVYGPLVLMFAKDYDATVNYDNDLLSWARCEKVRGDK